MDEEFETFIERMRACRICAEADPPLPRAPNPVFQLDPRARILIAGQAPGNLADVTARPFNDPSGERLREWLGVDAETFYDPAAFAILPMGLCFPGYAKAGGDLPPRKECAPAWRRDVFERLPNLKTRILIGGYAQKWHLEKAYGGNVTRTVENWRAFAPDIFPVPHPSWRNNAWLKTHTWFESELLPHLKIAVKSALSSP